MLVTAPLPRSAQFRLNTRAVWRDLTQRSFHKLPFHLRGVWRAVIAL